MEGGALEAEALLAGAQRPEVLGGPGGRGRRRRERGGEDYLGTTSGRSSITTLPRGAPSAVMSKNTLDMAEDREDDASSVEGLQQ